MSSKSKSTKTTPGKHIKHQPVLATGLVTHVDWVSIKNNAHLFAIKFKGEKRESGEKHTFWNAFFTIFGRARYELGTYEYHAKRHTLKGSRFIDLLWPGVLAVEHKSAGRSLRIALAQLREGIDNLKGPERPRYWIVCDFAKFRLINLETGEQFRFSLAELPENIKLFQFFVDMENEKLRLEFKANQEAVQIMIGIYAALRASISANTANTANTVNTANTASRLMIRLLFCMFADSAGIFERRMFLEYLKADANSAGADMKKCLDSIFYVLSAKRGGIEGSDNDGDIWDFPYVNGSLFKKEEGDVPEVIFDSETSASVLKACGFNWGDISPDIFGSLFQLAAVPGEIRAQGAHYTSKENIMRVIRPLFLDNLWQELNHAGEDKCKLLAFHEKIANLHFLDPACGCGNFLIVAYRELRQLEITLLMRLGYLKSPAIDAQNLARVSITQFHGVEKEIFPARIAQVAMWLVADQMNRELKNRCGLEALSIPLTVEADIKTNNALRLDWAKDIIEPEKMSYIFGNPPFIGKRIRNDEQKADMKLVFEGVDSAGKLDYVAAWYMKAAEYISGTDIKCAFVSTSSITQGEQVAVLWRPLMEQGVKIHFAHRSFQWANEASGQASVHVIIIGFGMNVIKDNVIYQYANIRGAPEEIAVRRINAYLTDADDVFVEPRSKPLCEVPDIVSGNVSGDKGHLILSSEERWTILSDSPEMEEFIRPAISAGAYLSGKKRWCWWLDGVKPLQLQKIKSIINLRLKGVSAFRRTSSKVHRQEQAKTPHLFSEIRQPQNRYILIPLTTGGRRDYVPFGFLTKDDIVLNSCAAVPGGDLYHFGVLSSVMHMTWMRAVAGRYKDAYSYSNEIVYNTFPWPREIADEEMDEIKKCALGVLGVRANYSTTALGNMYLKMPHALLEAHCALDSAVDYAYGNVSFGSESARRAFLFSEYTYLINRI